MGSSGTGSFGDYKPTNATTRCKQPVDTELEEAGRSAYVKTRASVPPKGTRVRLRTALEGSRLVVEEDSPGGLAVGFLPTKFNYLLLCLEDHVYTGAVTGSAGAPTAFVAVVLQPANR
jgi:hypothetical protein